MAKNRIEKEVLESVPEMETISPETDQTTKSKKKKEKKKKIKKLPLSQIERFEVSYKDGLTESQVKTRIEQKLMAKFSSPTL